MNRPSANSFRTAGARLTALWAIGLAASAPGLGQPHRQPCRTARCKAVRAFVKAHYCGESPFGNGPDDSCRIQALQKKSSDVIVEANSVCSSDENATTPCKQTGSIAPALRAKLLERTHELGMPTSEDNAVLFLAMKSKKTGWSLLQASDESTKGSKLLVCDLVVAIDPDGGFHELRKIPFQTTDAEVPTVTVWSAIDIADVNGQQEFILEGDQYEDHWFEAFSVRNGTPKLDFAGLGYYL